MRPNPLADARLNNTVAVGSWLVIPSSITAEFIANAGFDFCCIDMQHGLIDYRDALLMLQGLSHGTTTATVRVPWNEPGIIGKVLDAGAMAVIVPMINNAQDAELAVSRGMYAPRGSRSSGPTRVQPLEGPEYAECANDHVQIIPMIETVEAVQNLDAIIATPNVDTVFVGPMDLGVSMGLGRGTTDPSFFATLDDIASRCAAQGVVAGIFANPGNVGDMINRGFQMVSAQTDLSALRGGMADALSTGRGTKQSDTHSDGY